MTKLPLGHVLVTGGAGFIGSQLLQRLIPLCTKLTVIDNCSTGDENSIPKEDGVTFIKESYVSNDLLDELLIEVDYIFHLACSNIVISANNMDEDFRVNLFGGYELLKKVKAKCRRLKRFVYTSTASVYGNANVLPTKENEYKTSLPYSASKLSMEHYCQVFQSMYNIPITVLRLSNVYGPGQVTTNPYCGVIAKFFEAADKGEPMIVYGDGTQTRDFTYIEDVLDALILAATHPNAVGQVFNVGTAKETNINQLARFINEVTGAYVPIRYEVSREVDVVDRRCLDWEQLHRTLSWSPSVDLLKGLILTYQWKKGWKR